VQALRGDAVRHDLLARHRLHHGGQLSAPSLTPPVRLRGKMSA
jgi:hypothetical protein